MTIPPTFPFHVARAYGVNNASALRSAASPAASPAAQDGISQLLGGSVQQPVSFAGGFASAGSNAALPTLQLYTRAADKVEAATAVQIGRMFDLNG